MYWLRTHSQFTFWNHMGKKINYSLPLSCYIPDSLVLWHTFIFTLYNHLRDRWPLPLNPGFYPHHSAVRYQAQPLGYSGQTSIFMDNLGAIPELELMLNSNSWIRIGTDFFRRNRIGIELNWKGIGTNFSRNNFWKQKPSIKHMKLY